MARLFGVRFLAAACVVGLTLACFGPALGDGRQLAYRDFSHFYYPLYQRVQQEWEAGRLPLWAAEENGGSPMLGNPTSAVLYPGKLIYAALSYPRAAKAYVIFHVLLAFGAMAGLLRGWEVSPVGAALGGLAYAFGAPVLTQYSNVVFLVGAAWMPLGFRFADGWVRLRRPRALAGLAMVLAMQVLGGDPEAAYLTGLASAAYAVGRRVVGEGPGRRGRVALAAVGLILAYGCLLALEVADLPGPASPVILKEVARPWWRPSPSTAGLIVWMVAGLVVAARWRGRPGRLGGTLLGLIGAGALAAAMAGAQLVPTWEFIRLSTRVGPSPHSDIYGHSIHPARVVEWAWPGSFGSTGHRDRVWLNALPPTEDFRLWMSSVYLGGLTILLAAGAVGFRRGPEQRPWLMGVALVGILAGFGAFASPLFWARAVSGTEAHLGALEVPEPSLPRADGRLRDGDGGPYWFLATALPGFRSFRYPGKLFIPAALGMAALAGMGFDGLVAGRRRSASAMALTLLGAGAIGLGFAVARPGIVLTFLRGRAEAATSAFGPFDPSGAASDLRLALIHGSAVMVAFLVIARLAPRRPSIAGALAVLTMTADLALANRNEVATVAQSAYEADPAVLAAIRRAERDDPAAGPFRIFRVHGWVPLIWYRSTSPDRLEQMVRWERETLQPKYEQPLRVASTFAYGTAALADYGPFFERFPIRPEPDLAARLGLPAGTRVNYFTEARLRPLEHPLLHPAEPAVLGESVRGVRLAPALHRADLPEPLHRPRRRRPARALGAGAGRAGRPQRGGLPEGLGRPPGHPPRPDGRVDPGRSDTRDDHAALPGRRTLACRGPGGHQPPPGRPGRGPGRESHRPGGRPGGVGAGPGHRRRRPDPRRPRSHAPIARPGRPGRHLLSRLASRGRRPAGRDPPGQPGHARGGRHRRVASVELYLSAGLGGGRDRAIGRRPAGVARPAGLRPIVGRGRRCRPARPGRWKGLKRIGVSISDTTRGGKPHTTCTAEGIVTGRSRARSTGSWT